MSTSVLVLSILSLVALPQAQKPSHRVVIEVNVPGKQAYSIVLGNITNLRKALAPDSVEIEVVCEGKGVDMVLQSSPVQRQVASAEKSGVRFAACNNTLRFRHIDPKKLILGVRVVDAGVAEVVRKQELGWSYLKGAY